MKRKPIHIDWDELEAAFENRSKDLVHYLDLVTGEIFLEGQGEESEEGGEHKRDDEAAMHPVVLRPDTTRLYVSPFSDDDELAWAEAFVESATLSPEIRDVLAGALEQDSAEAFRDALRPHDETREDWFRHRSECLHQAIEAWLADHRLNVADPPPWK